jgi:hypothetical protein
MVESARPNTGYIPKKAAAPKNWYGGFFVE